jgi:hypothetical protein
MMFLYKLLGERANGTRDIRFARADRDRLQWLHDHGYQLFVLGRAREQLSQYGYGFAPYVASTPANAAALGPHALFRVTFLPSCQEIGNLGPVDITRIARPRGRLSVRIDNYRPFEATVITYAAADAARVPAIVGAKGKGVPSLAYEAFAARDPAARSRLAAHLQEDGFTAPDTFRTAGYVVRTESRVNDRGDFATYALDLGAARAVLASARVDQDTPRRATVCSYSLADVDAWPQPGGRGIELLPDSDLVEFEQGWYPVERRADGLKTRWSGAQASIVLPVATPTPMRFVVNAAPLDAPRTVEPTITLVVNGHRLPTQPLPSSRAGHQWEVGADVLRSGLNEFALEITGAARPAEVGLGKDTRVLGVSVSSLELQPVAAGSH